MLVSHQFAMRKRTLWHVAFWCLLLKALICYLVCDMNNVCNRMNNKQFSEYIFTPISLFSFCLVLFWDSY